MLVDDSPQQESHVVGHEQLQPLPDRSILSTDRTRVVRLPYNAYEQIEDQQNLVDLMIQIIAQRVEGHQTNDNSRALGRPWTSTRTVAVD